MNEWIEWIGCCLLIAAMIGGTLWAIDKISSPRRYEDTSEYKGAWYD